MRKSFSVFGFTAVLFVCVSSVSLFFGQTRTRTGNDFKVRYKTSMMSGGAPGQTSESITMIKGARERSESSGFGFSSVNITQCDLKRSIQISESTRKYVITPMEPVNSTNAPPAPVTPSTTTANRRGGVVTYKTTSIDTGERKEMFGFTARHIKSSTLIESSPDACSPIKHKSELDGWYIDLAVALDCQYGRNQMTARAPVTGRCIDQTRFLREGNGKLGFPLIETVTMYGENGQVTFSTSKEVVELSRDTLDAALFDVPAGYTEAATSAELYGAPSMGSVMASTSAMADTPSTPSSSTSMSGVSMKRPGSVLIGVVQFNNKSGKAVTLDVLRQRLIGQLTGGDLSAIALNASSQMEAEVEAKTKQCDFILYTDVVTLKMSKVGGMFGQVTGVGGLGKTEAKIEYKLFATGESAPRLQSSASAKEEGDEVSAGSAVDAEARAVSAEARKKGRG
jgi:hypothetical protein